MTKKSFGFFLCTAFIALTVLPLHAAGINDLKSNLKSGKITKTVHNTDDSAKIDTTAEVSVNGFVPSDLKTKPIKPQKKQPAKPPVKIKTTPAKPRRIQENLSVSKPSAPIKRVGGTDEPYPQIIVTELPSKEEFLANVDAGDTVQIAAKTAAYDKLLIMKNRVLAANSFDWMVESDIFWILNDYPNFVDICAYTRLYYAEMCAKSKTLLNEGLNIASNMKDDYELYYKNDKIYKNLVTALNGDTSTDPPTDTPPPAFTSPISAIAAKTNSKSDAGLIANIRTTIRIYNKKTETSGALEVENDIKKAYAAIEHMTTYVYSDTDTKPDAKSFQYYYDQITKSHNQLLNIYIATRNFAKYTEEMKRFEEYYSQIPLFHNIKYKEKDPVTGNMTEKTLKIDFKKSPDAYVQARMSGFSLFTCAESTSTDEELKAKADELIKYIAGIPHKSGGKDSEDDIPKSDKDNYTNTLIPYKTNRQITKIWFSENENTDKEAPKDNIYEASAPLTLRCQFSRDADLRPVKIDITSSVSKKTKTLTIKFRCMEPRGHFRCTFAANDGNGEDIIDNTPNNQKKNLAVIRAESGTPFIWNLYSNPYFKNKLGLGTFENSETNFENLIFKLSENFFKSGGIEPVKCEYGNIKCVALIKNQADWLVFVGHGNPKTGSIGMEYSKENPNPNAIILIPRKDKVVFDEISNQYVKVPGLIRNDGTSEYSENVDVLMQTSCGVLNTPDHIKDWHNVLPKGIILGYNVDIYQLGANEILAKFNTLLNNSAGSSLSFEEIGNKWCEYNREISDNYGTFTSSRYYSAFYTYIYDDLCFKGGRKNYFSFDQLESVTEYYEGVTSLK